MIKMDKFWLATASLLYPFTGPERLVTLEQIRGKYLELFEEVLSPSMEQQLISWKPRYADKANVTRGGSRKRYLFRTDDGRIPYPSGRFRLYKNSDSPFNGEDKTGPSCPEKNDVSEPFRYLIDWYLANYLRSSIDLNTEAENRYTAEISAEEYILNSDLSPTEKESLVKARRGQGIFKGRVAEVESGCRLTGVTDIRFLVASHIKPWAASNNDERLDGCNGLLLAPHADRLFDNGFITFSQDGAFVVSSEAEKVCQQWKLTKAICKPLTQQQEDYMRYHREHIFRDGN